MEIEGVLDQPGPRLLIAIEKELDGYFTFYNKNDLHYRVKVMFLSI
jgi:hypothetical protein